MRLSCLKSTHLHPKRQVAIVARGSDPNRRKPPFHSRSHNADFSRTKSISRAAICACARQNLTGIPPAQYCLDGHFRKGNAVYWSTICRRVSRQRSRVPRVSKQRQHQSLSLPPSTPIVYRQDLHACCCNFVFTRSTSRSRPLLLYNHYLKKKGAKSNRGISIIVAWLEAKFSCAHLWVQGPLPPLPASQQVAPLSEPSKVTDEYLELE